MFIIALMPGNLPHYCNLEICHEAMKMVKVCIKKYSAF